MMGAVQLDERCCSVTVVEKSDRRINYWSF